MDMDNHFTLINFGYFAKRLSILRYVWFLYSMVSFVYT